MEDVLGRRPADNETCFKTSPSLCVPAEDGRSPPTRGRNRPKRQVFADMLTNCCEVENAHNSMEVQMRVFLLLLCRFVLTEVFSLF